MLEDAVTARAALGGRPGWERPHASRTGRWARVGTPHAPSTPLATPSSTRSWGRMRSWSAVASTWWAGRLRIAAASSGAMTEK